MFRSASTCDRSRLAFVVIALILLLCAGNSRAQQEVDANDVKRIGQQLRDLGHSQQLILRDLNAIKLSLENKPGKNSAPSVPPPVIRIDGMKSHGSSDAPVTLLAFTGYECSHCAKFAIETEPIVKREYVIPGKVRYVFGDFVFDSQKNGFVAARAAHCAGDQDRFWEMHDLIFSSQGNAPQANLMSHAQSLNLDTDGFKQCLDDGLHADSIERSMATGKKLGVTGTPTFCIGVSTGTSNEIQVVQTLRGNVAYDVIKRALDAALTRQ